jgi:hypothetical protein
MSVSDFFHLLQDVRHSVNTIDGTIESVKRLEQQAQQSPSEAQAKIQSIERVATIVDGQYDEAQQLIGSVLKLLEAMRTAVPSHSPAPFDAASLPSASEVQRNLLDFFRGDIKRMIAPIPNYAGCYARRIPNVAPGSFVCARLRNAYVLMVMWRSDGNAYDLYDPGDLSDGVKPVTLPKEDWTPLPTIITEKPLKRWEYSKNSPVLALRRSGDAWTTEFFQAVIAQQPCERPDEEPRGYRLRFEDGEQIVPEKFVAVYSEEWRRADLARL